MPQAPESVLGLDVGGKRIGVAVASLAARLPQPLTTLPAEDPFAALKEIIERENAIRLVVGLPRGLEGQSTDQTAAVQDFVKQLGAKIDLPVDLQDEALTSQKAAAELESRRRPYEKSDIDALAATYILEDWLAENA
jgi:putative holliday junction resolvase